jgi:hypothetical protein
MPTDDGTAWSSAWRDAGEGSGSRRCRCCWGALLLARTLPLVAEVLKLPGNRVLALMQQGPAPSDKELELCIATRQKSLACMMVMRCRSY